MRNTSPRLILSALCLAMSATAAMADPLVMGPTPVAIGTYTAFDVSNTATYVDQNNTAGLFPPFLLTENIIAAGTSSQTTQLTFANGSAALAVGSTAAGFSTSPTVTSISGQISNHRGITVSTANDPPDTITAYAGSSMFFNFTITQTAAVTMNWSIAFTGAAPTQTVMFWDISGSNPFLGSVASSTN
ncbi:MAG: hypothetical protein Q8L55_10050, partial [Phycisphaerales bacterium]|nr:hypothetical protein [Phycisphaerales bacterium]